MQRFLWPPSEDWTEVRAGVERPMGQLAAGQERVRPQLREAEETAGGAVSRGQCPRSG